MSAMRWSDVGLRVYLGRGEWGDVDPRTGAVRGTGGTHYFRDTGDGKLERVQWKDVYEAVVEYKERLIRRFERRYGHNASLDLRPPYLTNNIFINRPCCHDRSSPSKPPVERPPSPAVSSSSSKTVYLSEEDVLVFTRFFSRTGRGTVDVDRLVRDQEYMSSVLMSWNPLIHVKRSNLEKLKQKIQHKQQQKGTQRSDSSDFQPPPSKYMQNRKRESYKRKIQSDTSSLGSDYVPPRKSPRINSNMIHLDSDESLEKENLSLKEFAATLGLKESGFDEPKHEIVRLTRNSLAKHNKEAEKENHKLIEDKRRLIERNNRKIREKERIAKEERQHQQLIEDKRRLIERNMRRIKEKERFIKENEKDIQEKMRLIQSNDSVSEINETNSQHSGKSSNKVDKDGKGNTDNGSFEKLERKKNGQFIKRSVTLSKGKERNEKVTKNDETIVRITRNSHQFSKTNENNENSTKENENNVRITRNTENVTKSNESNDKLTKTNEKFTESDEKNKRLTRNSENFSKSNEKLTKDVETLIKEKNTEKTKATKSNILKENNSRSRRSEVPKRKLKSRPPVQREYSPLEDHTVVSLVQLGDRSRHVSGNALWRSLQEQHLRISGVSRTWQSLRNRYLRYILPRLPDLHLAVSVQSALRAGAARGVIKRKGGRASIFNVDEHRAASTSMYRNKPTKRSNESTMENTIDYNQPSTSKAITYTQSKLTTPRKSPRITETSRTSEQTDETARKAVKNNESARSSSKGDESVRKTPKVAETARKRSDSSSSLEFTSKSRQSSVKKYMTRNSKGSSEKPDKPRRRQLYNPRI